MVSDTSLAMRYDTYIRHNKHKETFLNMWTVGIILLGILLLLRLLGWKTEDFVKLKQYN